MSSRNDRISEEAARAIWRRAAQLQAEAERRMDERVRQILPATRTRPPDADGLHPDDVRTAAEEAGISPEFVQIALAEASATSVASAPLRRWDILGAKVFLGSSRHTIEAITTVEGNVDTVSAAALQVFSGHPCLLQAGEVADLPSSGRVLVFNVPKLDWSVTANPPFVEKASMIGLRQLHVAVRPLPGASPACEVVVAGDLHPGMRSRWRWSAATSVGASAAGGAWGVGLAGSAMAGALLILPGVLGAAVISGAAVGAWAAVYRYYRSQVEKSLNESLQHLPAAARAVAAHQSGRDPAPRGVPPPEEPNLRHG